MKIFSKRMFFLGFLVLGVCTTGQSASAKDQDKIPVPNQIKARLNLILKITEGLHVSLVTKNEQLIATQTQSVLYAVESAQRSLVDRSVASEQMGVHQVRSLEYLLSDLKAALLNSQLSRGRGEPMAQALRQIVLLLKTFDINRSYQIYFCRKDKVSWFQKSGKPKNPLNPDSNCATKVK